MRRAKSDAVTKIGKIGDKYLLTEIEQPNKGAKSKSPSRTGAGKSPSRNEGFKSPNTKSKSPARKSPARKSPARKSPARKSPSRKSPARSETLVNTPKSDSKPKSKTTARRQSRSPARNKGTASGDQKNATQKTKTASKKGKIDNDELKLKKTIFDESDSDVEVVQNVKVKTPSRSSSRKIDVEGDSFKDINWKIDSNNYSSITRRTVLGHDRELHEIKNYDYLAKKLTELSDDDDIVSQNRKSLSRERAVEEYEIIEFGGCLGTSLLTILVPFGAIALHICCNEYQCTFNKLPSLGNYKKLATFFNLTTFLTHAAFLLILTLLSALPFGGKKIISLTTKQEKFEYRMNGLFCCFIILAVSIGLEVSRIPVFNFIYEHYFHFAITAIMFGLLLSIYAYIRSFYVPKNALNSNALDSSVYGFFMGRETNPRLFGIIDLKILCLRYLIIGTLMLNTAILYKSIGLISLANVKDVKTAFDLILPNLNSTLLVVYLTQTIYVIDSLMFEPAWLSSFEVRYEGFGYMVAMGYAVYPFLITSVTKYVYNYNVKLANWQLGIIVAVFLFGYILNRGSNNQKNKFRRNPYSPGVAYLESIPTSQGKKLLISGFWGFVRHPNYLGDIILNLSWYPFVLCAPPVTFILFTLLVLIHRASRDNTHCKIRYGPSWDRYCQKIKYKLIPKVY